MTELTCMTWNVRYFGHGLGGLRCTDGWMRLAAGALATVSPLPDVVALQEVETRSLRGGLGTRPQLDRFLDHLHATLPAGVRYRGLYFAAHRYAVRFVPPLYTTGLAVLVREGIAVEGHNADAPHDVTHVRLAAFARLKQRRIAGHVRLRKPGGEAVDLFNVHLSLPAFLEVGPHRVHRRMGHGSNQLREVDGVLAYVRRRAGPRAVLAGDFNAAPGSPVYDRIMAAGLVDAHATAGDRPADQHASARFLATRLHLDHVFSTPMVRWQGFHAHHIDEAGPFLGLSDHAPKVGRLAV